MAAACLAHDIGNPPSVIRHLDMLGRKPSGDGSQVQGRNFSRSLQMLNARTSLRSTVTPRDSESSPVREGRIASVAYI
jgi:hypothetical protein